jgi:hypothetical protein
MSGDLNLARQILDTLNRFAVLGRAGPESGDQQRRLYRRMFEMRRKLAAEFGNRFGWKPSHADFPLGKLSPQRVGERSDWWNDPYQRRNEYIDHPYYFRHPERPYRPAGIAAHQYDGFNDRIEAFADKLGIIAEPISDFPSWWYLGVTTLIGYRVRLIAELAEPGTSSSESGPKPPSQRDILPL